MKLNGAAPLFTAIVIAPVLSPLHRIFVIEVCTTTGGVLEVTSLERIREHPFKSVIVTV